MKKLSEILIHLDTTSIIGNFENTLIEDITVDSRESKCNSLFIAINGEKENGHRYIKDVIAKGASAIIVTDKDFVSDDVFINSGCIKIVVDNSRLAFAKASSIFFNNPSDKLNLIGITGTKGKTTTAFYIKHILENAGFKTGLIGTIANYIGDKVVETKLTTPLSNTLNKLFGQMIINGCSHCVMEVSSHSLDFNRVEYLTFDAAIFCNITSDHMDYHKTFDNYFNAKKKLFDMLPKSGVAITNIDDISGIEIVKNTKAKVSTYGKNESDYKIENINYSFQGTDFRIVHKNVNYELHTGLVGHFNAYNAASSFALFSEMGMDKELIIDGIKKTPQVPGRFEVIRGKTKTAIIDYSHTADSLQQALDAVKKIADNKHYIVTVFGCGGDRDKTKRPIMGKIATDSGDYVYVTSDNPRTEDPNKIIEEITNGITKDNYELCVNREEAIKRAIVNSPEGSIILIAGKGHECYSEVNGVRTHFSDKEKAEEYLARLK
ncbi:MAG: UDP-N-acetylmuramoyl-L-alanyl-D-glutamate--2,6-diaminopimelate ligase [Melioribacteraceae bacterium]|nr:UDP-N-acetylmuramoyl-L-alanyl-D-glutamate--2,6-diaminopimelate ligase [Melioribacteraceae bacterium]